MSDLKAKILLVDDEAMLLQGLRLHLRGYEVHTAENGEQALKLIVEHGPFAVIVSDMSMPGMDGITLLQKVREVTPDTVRVLLTGYANLDTAMSAINEGRIFRFLTKPCDAPVIQRCVKDAVNQYRLVTADRALVHKEVERLARQLMDADRLARLGGVTSGFGHRLNNITAVFMSVLDGVRYNAERGQVPSPDELEDLSWVGQTLTEHGRMLLDLGMAHGDHVRDVDLRETLSVAQDVLELMGYQHNDIEVELADESPIVRGREGQIRQVLVNLLANAVEAVEGVNQRRPRIAVLIGRSEDGQSAFVEIYDNGKGMEQDAITAAFTPFYTTKTSRAGTGLGLSVVKRIVEQSGGDIVVESMPDQGTMVRFHLPLAEFASEIIAGSPETDDPATTEIAPQTQEVELPDRQVGFAETEVAEEDQRSFKHNRHSSPTRVAKLDQDTKTKLVRLGDETRAYNFEQ